MQLPSTPSQVPRPSSELGNLTNPHQAPTLICKDLITVNYRINSASRLDPLIVHRYALGSNEKQIQFCSTFKKKWNFSCFYRVLLKLWFDMTCGRIMVEIFPLFPRDWTRSYFLPCNEQILSLFGDAIIFDYNKLHKLYLK